ncbi:hypothetical protein K1719_014649 [Acacia pycnantha]|nr:hypothetical protein K1719_014649 [Acacia pycnantha]
MLESLAKKTVIRREETEILKEELNSALKKVDDIMNKAENLKKLDLDEAESTDTSIDAKRRKQEEAQKERNEMYKMIDELELEDRKEFHPRNPGGS